jgi:hypothetical protein
MTEVTRDQFKWDGDWLTHRPTGARFNRRSQFVNPKRAGEDLEDGTCYEREDLVALAEEMIRESRAKG